MSLEAPALRKLLLVSLSSADASDLAVVTDPRFVMARLRHIWEFVEVIVSSADPISLAAARSLGRPVTLEPSFAAHAQPRAPETAEARAERVLRGLERIEATAASGALIVTDAATFAAIWQTVLGVAPPAGRPRWGDVGLLTRRADASWFPGRRCSDPEPLCDALERDGIASVVDLVAGPTPRHVASLVVESVRG